MTKSNIVKEKEARDKALDEMIKRLKDSGKIQMERTAYSFGFLDGWEAAKKWVEAESAPRYYRIIDNYTGQTIGLDDHEEDDPGGIVTYQEITEAQYLEYKALIDEDEFRGAK